MRFYTKQHRYYCGIDLHARRMYICILDAEGTVRVHRNGPATPEHMLATIAPYRDDVVVGVECMFAWYWVADLCAAEGIPFVLGHALYMKAIHGGKAKNDRSTPARSPGCSAAACSRRPTSTQRGCARPATCSAGGHFVRKRAELLTHVQNTNSQYNLPPFGKKLAYAGQPHAEHRRAFPDPRYAQEPSRRPGPGRAPTTSCSAISNCT